MSMIVPGSVSPMMAALGGNACEAYQIARSVRFNSAQSKYLSRTPGAASNQSKWTWSGWIKRSALGVVGQIEQDIFSAGADGNNETWLGFAPTGDQDRLKFGDLVASAYDSELITTQSFRDVGAHLHIVLVYDCANVVQTDRVKLYVNGVRITAFDTAVYTTNTTRATYINGTTAHRLGCLAQSTAQFFNGYISDVFLIDGQALDPSYFGFICPTTGQWRPKAYAGTYGANGFHLDFSDNSAATATALGADRSGNGNNWTPTNISVAAGTANDSLSDTTSNNWCTWNNIYPGDSANTNGGLDAPGTARGTFDSAQFASYWEITANAAGVVGGVVSASGTAGTVAIPSGSTYGFRYASGLLEYTTNGSTWTTVASGLSGQQFPYAAGAANSANFGQRAFAWTQPLGYATLCSKNLPSGGTVTVSGTFTGNASADGPIININGAPETLTINGNAVTFGTHADRLANGFKVRTTLAAYNTAGANTWVATVKSPQAKSLFKYQNSGGN